MSFENLISYILPISMCTCMQNFSTIFFTVQEIGPFSLFQNSALGKASIDHKCHFAIPWARSFQHQIVCKILSKYSKRFKSCFTFFRIRTSAKPRSILNFITIFKSVQEIGPFSLFQTLELGNTSSKGK